MDVKDITGAWDNKGDIVIGNDVWIGFEALFYNLETFLRCNDRCRDRGAFRYQLWQTSITTVRHDQAFLGLITDTSRRVSESALEHLAGETENIEADQ